MVPKQEVVGSGTWFPFAQTSAPELSTPLQVTRKLFTLPTFVNPQLTSAFTFGEGTHKGEIRGCWCLLGSFPDSG